MDSANIEDRDGNLWIPFMNEYSQRKLRCIAGAREGKTVDDPRLDKSVGISTGDHPMRPARDDWQDAIASPAFWD